MQSKWIKWEKTNFVNTTNGWHSEKTHIAQLRFERFGTSRTCPLPGITLLKQVQIVKAVRNVWVIRCQISKVTVYYFDFSRTYPFVGRKVDNNFILSFSFWVREKHKKKLNHLMKGALYRQSKHILLPNKKDLNYDLDDSSESWKCSKYCPVV